LHGLQPKSAKFERLRVLPMITEDRYCEARLQAEQGVGIVAFTPIMKRSLSMEASRCYAFFALVFLFSFFPAR